MSEEQKKPPEKVHGIAHLKAALVYSIGGLKRLAQETSFKHQCIAFTLVMVLLFSLGAGVLDYMVAFGLFMILLAVEAINTAIEEIVDKISPEWSVMARNAKDLGSFAALAIMLAYAGFLISVVYRFYNATL